MNIKKEELDSVRKIDGFPLGEEDAILALSQSPNYTACPNPYIGDFIGRNGSPYQEETDRYQADPFVGDVSEGKGDIVYNAHTYHTKVPYRAIQKFIEHYTQKGDVVFDGFSGSGMTGVAAKVLGRNAVLSDLSPFASFMTYNFTSFDQVDPQELLRLGQQIIAEVSQEFGWMLETTLNGRPAKIDYAIWSDVFICPYCQEEFVYADAAADFQRKVFESEFRCPQCKSELEQKKLERIWSDGVPKRVPVTLHVTDEAGNSDFKTPDRDDWEKLEKIDQLTSPYWYPQVKYLFKGEGFGDMYVKSHHKGLDTVDKFYTKRNLCMLAALFDRIQKLAEPYRSKLLFVFTSIVQRSSLLNRLRPSLAGDPMTGTLYIASMIREEDPLRLFESKLQAQIKAFNKLREATDVGEVCVQTCSATDLGTIPPDSIDYIFTDPPFGRNIMYSELNFLWESWLRVFTNNQNEAVKNNSQHKGVSEYRQLMLMAFQEFFRILKPNRWITVEFHNSEAVIWNSIQESLTRAGFIIAQVATLDKKQGSYKQVTEAGSVKHDLVINAYKPKRSFQEAFLKKAGYGAEFDFLNQHLQHLPVAKNIERTEQMLYSKMIAYYIMHGYEINMNAKDFYAFLSQNFIELDGFWFCEEQVMQYEQTKNPDQMKNRDQAVFFISDEKSAITWLYHFLEHPKDYSDVYIAFSKALMITEDEIPDLKELLLDNFILEAGRYRRPSTFEHQAMNEKRERKLLREFEELLTAAKQKKKLQVVRKEAVIAGFKLCYQERRFEDILLLADKLNKRIIENSVELYDYIDIAKAKLDR